MSLLSHLTRRAAGALHGALCRGCLVNSSEHLSVLNTGFECLRREINVSRAVTAENSLPAPKSNCRGTETTHLEGLALSCVNSVELLYWHIHTKVFIC